MKLTNVFLWILLMIGSQTVIAQEADDIIGKYHMPNDLDIEIFKQQDKYFGKIIKLNDFKKGKNKANKNQNKAKSDDSLLGKIILKNLNFDLDKKQWTNGKIYTVEKGLVFNIKITELRANEIEVVGSKYFFRKTMVWLKI